MNKTIKIIQPVLKRRTGNGGRGMDVLRARGGEVDDKTPVKRIKFTNYAGGDAMMGDDDGEARVFVDETPVMNRALDDLVMATPL
jgi:hypothetical protein